MIRKKVTIIGGGVIGLAIGYRLLKLGVKVEIFNQGECGDQASSKAAGMIAPISEVKFREENLINLFVKSHALYPEFITELKKDSGLDIDWQTKGSVLVAIDQDDALYLDRIKNYQQELGFRIKELSPEELFNLEPMISPYISKAILAEEEYLVDNHLMVQALKKAFLKLGGVIFENEKILKITIKDQTVVSMESVKQEYSIDQLILAAGAKIEIDGLPSEITSLVYPIKGQILTFKMKDNFKITHMIRSYHQYPVYLVPRSDGRMIVGATSEEMGFDHHITGKGLLELIYGASKVLPGIEEMNFVKAEVGFRPATLDQKPVIGDSHFNNLYLALGMHRHGFLLTPIVSQWVADLVTGKGYPEYAKEYSYRRFL